MTTPLEALPNVGPKVAAALCAIGIDTAEALRTVGAVDAYRRLRQQEGSRWNLMCLYALQAGLLGMHVFDMPDDLKARLRAELDTLTP